jgi:thaumarchaeosortase
MSRLRTSQVFAILLAMGAIAMVVLPFVTTFDDALTAVGMRLGIAQPLQLVVPVEVRTTVALLTFLGIHAGVAGDQLVVWNSSGAPQTLFVSWNCVGWQSLILLGLTLAVGLRGQRAAALRLEVILFGIVGTVLVNIARIAAVCLLAASVGYTPALLFHDYGGTLLLIAWLFAFWAIAFRWFLDDPGLKADIAV